MNTTDSRHLIGIRLGAGVAACLAVLLAAGCGSSSSKTDTAASGGTTAAASTASTAGSSAAGSISSTSSTSSTGPAVGATSASAATSTSLPPKPTTVGPGGPGDCSTDMLSFTIQPLREPINHVMIEAKNTSRLPCHLNKYPLLQLSRSGKTPIGAAEATKPASVITLAPGATAYAGLMTSSADGSGKNGTKVPALLVELQSSNRDGSGSGRPALVPMPAAADYIDSSATVTYWESDLQSATY